MHQKLFSSLLILFLLHGVSHAQPPTIRRGSELCAQEQQFLTQRLPYCKKAIESFIGQTLADDEVPRIALCCSGGSYRAMISLFGALQGLQTEPPATSEQPLKTIGSDIIHYAWTLLSYFTSDTPQSPPPDLGLLNLCTYASATSGSCWAVAGLLQSGMSVSTYMATLTPSLEVHLFDGIHSGQISYYLLTKYFNRQPLSLIDVFGCLLAQKIVANLGYDNPQAITIVDHQPCVNSGHAPLPLYTALIANTQDYQWVEFSPFEVGCPYLNAYIPTQHFGQQATGGIIHGRTKPQSLGFCMGIWGSGISLNMYDFVHVILAPEIQAIFTTYLMRNPPLISEGNDDQEEKNPALFTERLSPARVYNWAFHMPDTPLATQETVTLIDAGFDFNIPIPPLLNRPRTIDIIIMFDATIDNPPGTVLHQAAVYAHKHNLPFPHIDLTTLAATCSVHRGTDPKTPTIIYLPLIKNDLYCNGWDPRTASFTGTLQFIYTQEQIALLSGLAQFNMAHSRGIIREVIKECVVKKRSFL